jgi:hypothetical protein
MKAPPLVLVLFCAAGAGAALGASCGSDNFDTNRMPTDAFIGGITDGPELEAGIGCPESPPKTGEVCPPMFLESNNCTFQVGTCVVPSGAEYPDYITYCCVKGAGGGDPDQRSWQPCGGMSQCDLFDASRPVDGPPADGSGDAPDGGG